MAFNSIFSEKSILKSLMDPFYLIKQEIATDVEHIQELVDTRNDMIHDPRGVNFDVFKNLGVQSTNEINSVLGLLKDTEETIEHVRANPSNFPQVIGTELQNRANFCNETREKIKKLEETIKEQSTQISQSVQYIKKISSTDPNDFEALNSEPNDINGNELASTFLEQHDEEINHIDEMAKTQYQLARQISNELDEQQQIIIELDEGIDSASDAMKSVTDQIKKVIENEGKLPTGIAFVLAIILILLLFIAI